MNVTAVNDLSNYLTGLATANKNAQVQQQIGVSVLKGILDQQENSGQALVEMIQQSSLSPDLGSQLDILA